MTSLTQALVPGAVTRTLWQTGRGKKDHVTTLSPIVSAVSSVQKRSAKIYGKAATVIRFSSACGPVIMGYLHGTFGSYPPVLLVTAGATALSCASLYFGGIPQRLLSVDSV
jgi:cyanate permease